MKDFKYVLTDPMGIHARPAGLLVKEASQFASTIKLAGNNKEVDAKRIMAVMSLGAKAGDTVRVIAEGEDEADAAAKLQEFFKSQL